MLLSAVADGDRDALKILFDRHANWLTLRLSRRCADPGVVEEVLQDTFVAAWKGASRYAGRGEVGAWLWGIAVRRLLEHFRRKKVATRTLVGDVGVSDSAEEQVLLGIQHGRLAPALASLAPELRAVVQATVLDGLTTREASTLLGIPAGTVKTRMMRARAQLREVLA